MIDNNNGGRFKSGGTVDAIDVVATQTSLPRISVAEKFSEEFQRD